MLNSKIIFAKSVWHSSHLQRGVEQSCLLLFFFDDGTDVLTWKVSRARGIDPAGCGRAAGLAQPQVQQKHTRAHLSSPCLISLLIGWRALPGPGGAERGRAESSLCNPIRHCLMGKSSGSPVWSISSQWTAPAPTRRGAAMGADRSPTCINRELQTSSKKNIKKIKKIRGTTLEMREPKGQLKKSAKVNTPYDAAGIRTNLKRQTKRNTFL